MLKSYDKQSKGYLVIHKSWISHLNLEKFWLIWQEVSTDIEKLSLYFFFSTQNVYVQ